MIAGIAVAILFVIVMASAQVWTEVAWYSQVGYTEVFTTQWLARLGMFLVFGLIAGAAVWFNAKILTVYLIPNSPNEMYWNAGIIAGTWAV